MEPLVIITTIISLLIMAALILALWEVRHPIVDYVLLKKHKSRSSKIAFDKSLTAVSLVRPNKISENCKARILFFSDLHAELCRIGHESLCEIIKNEHNHGKLDAVVFGGDIVSHPGHIQKGRNYMLNVSDLCNELDIPFIGVTGNHDVLLTKKDVASCGMVDLRNTYKTIPTRDGKELIAFTGVDDTGRKNRVWQTPPFVPKAIEDIPVTANIMVCHNPDYLLNIDKTEATSQTGLRITHMLSGHIHGGQIRTPFGIEFTVLRRDLLPKKYNTIAGVYKVDGVGSGLRLFISRGLGNVMLPLRFFCRPEVSVIEIA